MAGGGGGGGGKKDRGEGLGRALVRQRNKQALAAKARGQQLVISRRAQQALPLESVIEVSDIDAVLQRAAEEELLHGDDAEGAAALTAALGSGLIDLDGTGDTEEERRLLREEQEALHADSLRVPRRPPWTAQMTTEELDTNEKRAFLEWRRNLARLQENEELVFTPFEKNLDIWRQLWRVLERSDLLVMVVDSRNPLFYRCPDLEEYAQEIDEHKRTLLLVNKADLLPLSVRRKWADYFKQHDILYLFWSAKAATAVLEGKKLSSQTMEESDTDLDTKIYGREELLVRLQGEAEYIVSQKGTSAVGEKPESSSESALVRPKRVVVGFVGYPNVGKSSTINALVGEKKTGVTSTPGKTKHFQTLIISEELMLCDCPGLVFPSFSSSRHEMVACGVLPIDRMTKHRGAIQVVANRVPRNILEQVYKITLPKPKAYEEASRPPTAAELLMAYCTSRGHVSHAGLPDETRAARQILKDYIDGKIPHFELPPGEIDDETDGEDNSDIEGSSTAAADQSDDDASDEDDEEINRAEPNISHALNDLASFDMHGQMTKGSTKKKKKEASHKHHRKPQRKKDRSWRVGNDGADGSGVIRVFQKPAVNLAASSTSVVG
ncbi:GTPase LSG1-2 [Aegilops tauschii subsp. strangulata]|nr:GTPase LSG1-2 [Aegilops tauschii subsp. strangulata]